jgi:tetratricopeptide (TPR) repeat protein
MRRTTLTLLGALLCAAPARAADPWHLAGWEARAAVEITAPAKEPGVDTAGVKVLCQGRGKPDGSDYRVVDAAGKPVPFLLAYHDPARYSLISFRAADPKGRYFVYFGNPKAERAKEMVVDDPKPGSGPPKGDWVPKQGFVLQTMQRPEGDNPRTPEDMAKLIAGSKEKYGARYQRQVSEGYNVFGPSDYYVSVYRGWITVPQAGKYQFCTVSNEASFSFLDGKELVHWPGRHTTERGARGEVNATVELAAGLHYLEYYHEEVTLDQMAFLGWRHPLDAPQFSPVPESVYTAAHAATVARYEDTKNNPLPAFEPAITDSVWPVERHEGQYTRARFRAGPVPAPPAGTTYRWDFGDGQSATGPEAEHVYLTLGTFNVTLTAQGPAGTQTVRWPLLVFEIEHVTDQFKEGRPKEYAQTARGYDRAKLDAAALKELTHLFAEADEPAEALAVGKAYVERFPGAKPLEAARVRRLMADCAIRLGQGSLDEAVKNYQAALTDEVPAEEKLDTLARLVRLVGLERGEPAKAVAVVARIEETYQKAKKDRKETEEVRAAYRRAVVAAGDVLLFRGKRDEARGFYAAAEKLGPPIPPQVRAARVGAYPNALREYVAAGNFGAALDLVDRWDETFPADKLGGQSAFWRGKVLLLRDRPRDAERYLGLALRLAPGAADFETEARWLLAQALERQGRRDDSRRELARLVKTGIDDEYTRQAKKKLLP